MKSKSVAAGVEDTEHEVAESEKTQPLANGPSIEEVRQRAYELHLERGCIHGWDQDDWLQAERELIEKFQAR
jgi:hypothetical protein